VTSVWIWIVTSVLSCFWGSLHSRSSKNKSFTAYLQTVSSLINLFRYTITCRISRCCQTSVWWIRLPFTLSNPMWRCFFYVNSCILLKRTLNMYSSCCSWTWTADAICGMFCIWALGSERSIWSCARCYEGVFQDVQAWCYPIPHSPAFCKIVITISICFLCSGTHVRQISHRHHLTLSDFNGTLQEVFISSASYVSEQGGDLSNCLDGFISVNTLVFH
jgi:hypothetical protein